MPWCGLPSPPCGRTRTRHATESPPVHLTVQPPAEMPGDRQFCSTLASPCLFASAQYRRCFNVNSPRGCTLSFVVFTSSKTTTSLYRLIGGHAKGENGHILILLGLVIVSEKMGNPRTRMRTRKLRIVSRRVRFDSVRKIHLALKTRLCSNSLPHERDSR